MSVKMYNEDYINETAKAILKLTGRTEKMKVSEFADILNTYMEPDDLTNVHKVRITVNDIYAKWGSDYRIIEIEFRNSSNGDVYVYTGNDSVTCTPETTYSPDRINYVIDNNHSSPDASAPWAYDAKPIIEITFPVGMDMTYYDLCCIYSYAGRTETRNITVDVKTGTSDYYTRLVNHLELNKMNDSSKPQIFNLGHENYKYIRFTILKDGNGNLTNVTSTLISWVQALRFSDSEDNVFTYITQDTATTNASSANNLNRILTNQYCWSINGTDDSGYVYVDITLSNRIIDVSLYNHITLYGGDDYNIFALPGVYSLYISNDSDFVNYRTLAEQKNADVRKGKHNIIDITV